MAQIEAYNRFKELQNEYGQQFRYEYKSQELRVACLVCYLPFEGRFDKETFELFLLNTMPKELLMMSSSSTRVQRTRDFCQSNLLPITIHQAPCLNKSFKLVSNDLAQSSKISRSLEHINSFKIQTHTAVKQVLIDDLFYRYLPLQKITAGSSSKSALMSKVNNDRSLRSDISTYQVARVKAVIKVAPNAHREPGMPTKSTASVDQITLPTRHLDLDGRLAKRTAPDPSGLADVVAEGHAHGHQDQIESPPSALVTDMYARLQDAFFNNDEKPSLFFRQGNDYSLRDLQQFLNAHNFPTVLLDGCLNYEDKLYVYFDKAKKAKDIDGAQSAERQQLKVRGTLCKEYFQVRRLIYQHFGRI